MNGISLVARFDDRSISLFSDAIDDIIDDLSPMAKGIATILENNTRERFATELSPDGERWEPSIRSQVEGGRTLTKSGHLGDSITSTYNSKQVEVGTNRIYGSIHQFGGIIKASSNKGLRFKIPGAGFVTVDQVKIPQREYLGFGRQDQEDVQDFVGDYWEARLQ